MVGLSKPQTHQATVEIRCVLKFDGESVTFGASHLVLWLCVGG